jgi:penicillin-binding protein 1A
MKGYIAKSLIFIIVLVAGIVTGSFLALSRGVPRVEEIKEYRPATGTKVYADDDTLIGEFKIEKGIHVSISKVPEHLIRAVISVEDAKFWLHEGVDYVAIIRALLSDVRAGKIKEGASTITQQLAKVVFLSPERTIVRKLKEATLAFRLENNLTKEEILELYLNKIYFGHGAYGVEMAARAHFGKTVSELGLSESALLAGLIKAPSRYSPYSNLNKAKERQFTVLKRMKAAGYITETQVESAFEESLYLASAKYERDKPGYFLEYIRKYLEDRYGVEMIYKGGLKVHTALNRKVQAAASKALKTGLQKLDKRQGFRGPIGHKDIDVEKELQSIEDYKKVVIKKGDILTATVLRVSPESAMVKARGVKGLLYALDAKWARKRIDSKGNEIKKFKTLKLDQILKPGDLIKVSVKKTSSKETVFSLDQDPLVQGALVALEPATGYIRAILGGYDFNKSEFNRAVSARRQAGSAFKPITYAAAMDHGFTPASIVIDEPLLYESEEYGDWEPENYDEKYHGVTRLREALQRSRNIVTVKLLEELGVSRVIQFARSLGINGPFPRNLTLGLGSLSITPLEITSAFNVLAAKGIRMEPIVVKYVLDPEGNVLESNRPNGVRAINAQTAYLATSMLEDVVKKGTGWRAKALKRPVAGKTGTTNEYRDAWFLGYTTDLTAGVWVGFDSMRSLGKDETGSKAAAPIWVSFMKKALKEITPYRGRNNLGEDTEFKVPEGIVTAIIDPLTGLLATKESEKMVEFFKEGTVPTVYAEALYRDIMRRNKEELRAFRKKDNKKKKN